MPQECSATESAEGKDSIFKTAAFLIKEPVSQRGDKVSCCKYRPHRDTDLNMENTWILLIPSERAFQELLLLKVVTVHGLLSSKIILEEHMLSDHSFFQFGINRVTWCEEPTRWKRP